jgi:hypothetical protein
MGRTKRVVIYLAEHGALPGKTRMEIRRALGLPADAEITMRIREARTPEYGKLRIECMQISKTEFRYWLPQSQLEKARKLAAKWKAEERSSRKAAA